MELKLDRNKTYGLALEGGGAKGAYQIGAWKALREAGIRFSAVSGTCAQRRHDRHGRSAKGRGCLE